MEIGTGVRLALRFPSLPRYLLLGSLPLLKTPSISPLPFPALVLDMKSEGEGEGGDGDGEGRRLRSTSSVATPARSSHSQILASKTAPFDWLWSMLLLLLFTAPGVVAGGGEGVPLTLMLMPSACPAGVRRSRPLPAAIADARSALLLSLSVLSSSFRCCLLSSCSNASSLRSARISLRSAVLFKSVPSSLPSPSPSPSSASPGSRDPASGSESCAKAGLEAATTDIDMGVSWSWIKTTRLERSFLLMSRYSRI